MYLSGCWKHLCANLTHTKSFDDCFDCFDDSLLAAAAAFPSCGPSSSRDACDELTLFEETQSRNALLLCPRLPALAQVTFVHGTRRPLPV